ncbi:MAG: rRNA maturation RNase YbeY [Kiritimatiellae bacterium]|nr:rRNA maturation RNase YbeY [Kiritimatiellia bacterium]
MTKVQKLDRNQSWGELLLIITDDTGISQINTEVFGRTNATDVISVSYEPMPHMSDKSTAEIIVNIQRAVETSDRIGKRWTKQKEFALYTAHGCDHLWGEDDHDEHGRKRMRRRELSWLKEINKDRILDTLF